MKQDLIASIFRLKLPILILVIFTACSCAQCEKAEKSWNKRFKNGALEVNFQSPSDDT